MLDVEITLSVRKTIKDGKSIIPCQIMPSVLTAATWCGQEKEVIAPLPSSSLRVDEDATVAKACRLAPGRDTAQ